MKHLLYFQWRVKLHEKMTQHKMFIMTRRKFALRDPEYFPRHKAYSLMENGRGKILILKDKYFAIKIFGNLQRMNICFAV